MPATPEATDPSLRPRLFVLTDISSLTPGEREPDDGQSMIRLMLYANDLDPEGLAATSCMGHGHVTRPDLIREVIDAYGQVQRTLAQHDPRYPAADRLHALVAAGNPVAGPDVPVESCVGEHHDTDASRRLIAAADRDDPRPLFVTVWGGTADLAQALWRVAHDRTPAELDRFAAKLRIIAVGDQDTTGPWIRARFPGVWYWKRTFGVRGMYRGGDEGLTSSEWVATHIRGRGPLGALYPDYRGGDIWSATRGPVRGIKEGDTPSYLGLIPLPPHRPLIERSDPTVGGWGGLAAPTPDNPRHFVDAPDPEAPGSPDDPSPLMSAVYRWRPAFQADFAARVARCVTPS